MKQKEKKTLNEELSVIKKMMGLNEEMDMAPTEPGGMQFWYEGMNYSEQTALIISTDYKTSGMEYHIKFEVESEPLDASVGYGGYDDLVITGGYKIPTKGSGERVGEKEPLTREDIELLESKKKVINDLLRHYLRVAKEHHDEMGI